jgi:cell division protease FtsH
VIGNLDEAFEMSKSVSSEVSPDLFHEESKKISFSQIKEALKQRFRMEEISRLGNIHLIYPAFNSNFYSAYISNELRLIADRFEKAVGIKITYAESIKEMIFEEGVVPSQGFRPLKSSIRFLIESSIANMLKQGNFLPGEDIVLDMEADDIILLSTGRVKARKRLHLPIRLAKRRKANPHTLAVTAVHEAGHALMYSIVYGKLPKSISISTSDFRTYGFMEGESILDVNSYDLIFRDAAVKLAGKKAEELVFKKDYHTTFGCISDMKAVTKMLLEVRRLGVLPDLDLVTESKHQGSGRFLRESGNDREWVKGQVKEISKLTEQLLEKHQKTLRIFIKVLMQNKVLKAQALEKALLAEGVQLKELLSSYPAITDYSGQLEEFMNLPFVEKIHTS